MIYYGEHLSGNNPEDWETISILRSGQLGLYGDGLEYIYEKNLRNCERDEMNAIELYSVFYPNDVASSDIQIRVAGQNAYRKALRIIKK